MPRDVVLDTHALLWLVSTPEKVSPAAREVLSRSSCTLWVSAVCAWELAIKTRLGRLDAEPLLSAWSEIINDMTISELAIDSADAIFAGRLPWEHRDPFDRMLVAQATRRNLTIATRDKQILRAALTPTLTV
ncbi:type II toxin-antitoxin system VapC family toxin [Mycobacterium riyadhense]|nr:type II toxin-antitoxin system VapC family toxin [Mycobacterium riyadhense]MCV7145696.1 type II toxin-antitoxin system VapC family toxin [Mycobacterium riyadhense]ORW77943.1 twitching motility protein PilT [Mycobacterium riyadhense]